MLGLEYRQSTRRISPRASQLSLFLDRMCSSGNKRLFWQGRRIEAVAGYYLLQMSGWEQFRVGIIIALLPRLPRNEIFGMVGYLYSMILLLRPMSLS
jgi:hypothetical protein